MNLVVSSYYVARNDFTNTHAQFAADAGLDYAIREININPAWPGTVSPVEIYDDGKLRVTFNVTVTINSHNSKTLRSVGRTYTPTTSSTPKSMIAIKSDIRSVAGGTYSIVAGAGGLFLSNSARVLGGDVFVNGKIEMKNSSQIGLAISPASVKVAHQICPNPADSTYPRVCASGELGQPISIENTAHIYADVEANNQTNGAGMSNSGLIASSGVEPQPLPVHDRATQVAAAIPVLPPYNTNWSCNSGSYTWPANLKITGNVSITNSCIVTVTGNVWITGTLELKNSGKLVVSDALGLTQANVMIDGRTAVFRNTALIASNVLGTGLQIISYWSTASCSPNCADVTGIDLYNSRDLVTIDLDNSAAGPNTIFYSKWTRALVANSGQIGALVGQSVELKNSGSITFGTSVGTGSTFWVIDGYRRDY